MYGDAILKKPITIVFVIAVLAIFSSCVDNSKAQPKGSDSDAVVLGSDDESGIELCGNSKVDPGEICDGNMILCRDIDSNVFLAGKAKCHSDCRGWKTLTCEYVESTCGDGSVEGAEKCDGNMELCRNIDSEKYNAGKAKCLDDCSGWSEITCEENCNSKDHTGCFEDNLYWYNSCGEREEVKEECVNGCENGVCGTVNSERKTVQWGTSESDEGNSIVLDSLGNIYVTGITYGSLDGSVNIGEADIFLTKFSKDGVKLWTKQYGTSSNEGGRSIAIDSADNIYITGETYGLFGGNTRSGGYDIFLIKLSSEGTELWTSQWGSATHDRGHSVAVDSSDNIYVTGYASSAFEGTINSGSYDIFLTKFASDGIKFWTKQWGTSVEDIGNSVSFDSLGNIYVTGYIEDSGFNSSKIEGDVFLTKFSEKGDELWHKQWGTSDGDQGRSVVVDSADNIFVTGTTNSSLDGNNNLGSYDIFLSRFATDGTKLWTKQWGTSNYDAGESVTIGSSGNIYVAGKGDGILGGSSFDNFVTAVSSDGTKLMNVQWGSLYNDFASSVVVDSSDNIYITGFTDDSFDGNSSSGNYDVFLSIIPAE